MEFEYMEIFKNYNCLCIMCRKLFIMEEYQNNPKIQIQKLKGKLKHYKTNNRQLQFEIKKRNYFYKLS